MKWTEKEIETAKQYNNQGLSPVEISQKFPNRSYQSVRSKLCNLGLGIKHEERKIEVINKLEKKLLKVLQSEEKQDIINLSNQYDVAPKAIQQAVENLKKEGYNVKLEEREVGLSKDMEPYKPLTVNTKDFFGGEIKFGAIADAHIGSKYERLDILNGLYDIFEKEGVKKVYVGGNYVDGEFYFNKYEVYTKGFDDMIDNFLKKYPKRKGIKTYFVSGDDHEGWWMQREGLDPGRVVTDRQNNFDRDDLVDLGYQERDIIFKAPKGEAIMRIMHAGGGTSYADSYATQKMVESFAEGEKPHILLVGHYHKSIYHTPRGIHTLQLGTTQDQTRFMRKRKLRAHLGGWLVEMNQAPTGEINRFKPEWLQFWGKEFYRSKIGK